MADNTAEIARIEGILAQGVSSTTVDGQSVTYDLRELRRQLKRLYRTDDVLGVTARKTINTINLGGTA